MSANEPTSNCQYFIALTNKEERQMQLTCIFINKLFCVGNSQARPSRTDNSKGKASIEMQPVSTGQKVNAAVSVNIFCSVN